MNKEEYLNWRDDARICLSLLYNDSDVKKVLYWFDRIKGSEERELIGNNEVDCMLEFVCAKGKFDMYNSLMSRLFIYAPLILEETK